MKQGVGSDFGFQVGFKFGSINGKLMKNTTFSKTMVVIAILCGMAGPGLPGKAVAASKPSWKLSGELEEAQGHQSTPC